MDSMKFNKILAGVLLAGILISVIGLVSNKLVKPVELEEHAYKIEGVDAASSSSHGAVKKVETADSVLHLIAGADVERGRKISRACAACHNFEPGGPNSVGPNLYGVVGRAKASKDGFKYSSAMAEKGGSWNYTDLNKFLWKPKKFIPGTKMTFIGLKKTEDRAAVIAWLRTLSKKSVALPSAEAIAAEKSSGASH